MEAKEKVSLKSEKPHGILQVIAPSCVKAESETLGFLL
jgi:hypothetical protein